MDPQGFTPLEQAIASALYQAVGQDYGLLVRTNDVSRLKPLIYRTRAAMADPLLDQIQIRTSPNNPNTELFFINLGNGFL